MSWKMFAFPVTGSYRTKRLYICWNCAQPIKEKLLKHDLNLKPNKKQILLTGTKVILKTKNKIMPDFGK